MSDTEDRPETVNEASSEPSNSQTIYYGTIRFNGMNEFHASFLYEWELLNWMADMIRGLLPRFVAPTIPRYPGQQYENHLMVRTWIGKVE